MADDDPEVQKKVVYEQVTSSGTSKQNVPVIIGVLLAVAVLIWLILTKYS